MRNNFRTYQLAVNFYRDLQNVQLPDHLKDQLNRAGSSIPLNLMEGYGRMLQKDKKRFYRIAFGSIREVQAICDIADLSPDLKAKIDCIAAHTWKLIHHRT
jgi:four helix bundle protein